MKFFERGSDAANLEPGLLQILRVFAVVFVLLQPLTRRGFGFWVGTAAPLEVNLLLTIPPALVVLALAFVPWFPHHLGRAYLPLTLTLICIPAIFDKFVILNWYIPPESGELIAFGLFIRLWFVFQVVTFLVAWQYSMPAVMLVGISLTLVDGLLTIPFVTTQGPTFSFFVGVLVARMVIVTGFSLGVAWLMQRQRAQRAQLEAANRKLALTATTVEQLAVSHERNRMAHELHDTLAHSLSAVSVQLEAVNALWDVEPAEARKILEQATVSTRIGLTEARRALKSLRASPLEDLGLTLAISTLAESVATRANLRLDLALPAGIDGLQPHVEQCIYRVAQEALENVTRHAHASNVWVALEKSSTQLALTVADNGNGFDPAKVNGDHFGIKGMRERAEMAGGKLVVYSAPSEGTRVRLEIGD